jgi:glutathione synthase/RimK-type ligase-like ATP-grasp enzyme
MPFHVIVVDRKQDLAWAAPDGLVVEAKDYVMHPARRIRASTRVINLCRDYSYMSLGYYCSLLAEARGHRVVPSVEVMLDLHWKRLLRIALPEINELIRRTFKAPATEPEPIQVTIFFSMPDDVRLNEAAKRIFELFRCPILTLELRHRNGWEVASIQPTSLRDLRTEQQPMFAEALNRYTQAAWPTQKKHAPARFSIAMLHDPKEKLPPSDSKALERFVRAGNWLGIEVEPITRVDYGRLLEYDALFIRETTALDHHTYRFAKKAASEGLPVIDDPQSILRCTNKIYLAEILETNRVPTPRTMILDRRRIGAVERHLGFPAVIKVPDSSFSRGVFKVADREQLRQISEEVFKDTDLVIAQEFISTDFDWRVGILDRQPLYVCQYFMARGHWQIIKHAGNGGFKEGPFRTMPVEEAPPEVVRIAVRAASFMGDGLYGVDLKQTEAGIYVIEVNDNPSIEAGCEDQVAGDDLYRRIMQVFVDRLERRKLNARSNGG